MWEQRLIFIYVVLLTAGLQCHCPQSYLGQLMLVFSLLI